MGTVEIMPPETKSDALAHASKKSNDAMVLMPVMDLEVAKQRLQQFQEFVKGYMVEGEDYGHIPGVKKPSLFKPGAEKLCELYGLADTYPEKRVRRIENWETGLFFYEFTCVLTKKGTKIVIGEGKGSCSSYESRYRFRDGQRLCPHCGKDAIIKGKEEYGGGWVCFRKKNGCGAKFLDGDQSIEGQQVGKVENENLHDVMNTVLKIAKKRAKIDAVIGATRSSGIFTQDVEEMGKAAAAPEETTEPKKAPTASVIGKFVSSKVVNGDVWIVVADMDAVKQEVTEYNCKIPKARTDLLLELSNAHGTKVELLTELRLSKDKRRFYEVKGVLGITRQDELEITDEDIPY